MTDPAPSAPTPPKNKRVSGPQATALAAINKSRHARGIHRTALDSLFNYGLILDTKETGDYGYVLTQRGRIALTTGIIDFGVPPARQQYALRGDREPWEMRLGDSFTGQKHRFPVDGGWVEVQYYETHFTLHFILDDKRAPSFTSTELQTILDKADGLAARWAGSARIRSTLGFLKYVGKTLLPNRSESVTSDLDLVRTSFDKLVREVGQGHDIIKSLSATLSALRAENEALQAKIKELDW